ncbi:protein of unknown function [Denitratisoma oestradiolicum]|uniref:Uncharacterized protein n=1 Tax=Denitratisoma oestradiolicum TaxID=311182 RepID=A0A6S6Y5X9_9PROT|nr:protein of unknown function [Denitratisoma oestradiolicum]
MLNTRPKKNSLRMKSTPYCSMAQKIFSWAFLIFTVSSSVLIQKPAKVYRSTYGSPENTLMRFLRLSS